MFKKRKLTVLSFFKEHRTQIVFLLLLGAHLFFRFYELEERNSFSWDQVDSAWAAKRILVNQEIQLVGQQAKGTSGFFTGPGYYYLVAVAYFVTGLDPIAAGLLAGFSSLFAFFVFYFLIKKLFTEEVALIALFINTFSFYVIGHERIQWVVSLIPPLSLIIFFTLYRVINGKVNYLPLLAIFLGLAFHLHFTAVFFPLIIFFALPFIPWNKKIIKHVLISFLLFFIWILPNFIYDLSHQHATSGNLVNYLETYYHGLYLTRIIQLIPDAFIIFEEILIGSVGSLGVIKPLGYFLLPIFFLFYFFSKPSKKRFSFCYLVSFWFLIPWLVFSVYSGEISDYYFSLTRPMVLMVLAYLTLRAFQAKNLLIKIALIVFWLYYAVANVQDFNNYQYQNFSSLRKYVINAIKNGEVIEFKQGCPESYLFYYYKEVKRL